MHSPSALHGPRRTNSYYVSDGKIRKRSVAGGEAQTIDFKATLVATPTLYTRRRDFDSTTRQALGIVRPVISPDGTKVAFAALGDIYGPPVGGKPENITVDNIWTPIRLGRRTAVNWFTRPTRAAAFSSWGSATRRLAATTSLHT